MLPSCFGILAEATNTKILTNNHPDFPHSHPDSLHSQPHSLHSPHSQHSHPDSPHSHPDFPPSHLDSPRSHPDSPRSYHSPHSVPRFPIPAFTGSRNMLILKIFFLNIHNYDYKLLNLFIFSKHI